MKNSDLRFGEWQVSTATNSISRGDDTRQIEPRAMDVLVTLCERAGTVVSADELLQACWGSKVYGDNPVHKTIAQLRQALGDSATAPSYIETIRKRGYRTLAEVSILSDTLAEPLSDIWLGKSPFCGLQAFDAAHAEVFFGRADATLRLLRAVVRQVEAGFALALVLGPSGSGKTSLIQAGLLSRLLQPQRDDALVALSAVTFDLGEIGALSPFTALGGALLDWEVDGRGVFPGASAESLGRRIGTDIDSVIVELRNAMVAHPDAKRAARVVLFIDRFEAIFSLLAASEPSQDAFLLAIDALARSGCAIVVVACRNDFYPRIAEYAVLMEGKPQGGHFDLSPPSQAEIAQMIRLPAAAARIGFGVDSESRIRLDDVLCESATGNPDALPLLQYTLQELYRLRTAEGELSFEAFHQLGGLEGVIGKRAEQTIAGLSAAQIASLPHVLSLVVTVSATGNAVTSRRAPWSALRHDDERQVVNALVESRLFVSELVDDSAGFGVAHEALLRRWPRVTVWIATYRDALRIRDRVAAQSARWVSEGRPHDLLLPSGKQLDEARSLLGMAAVSLSADDAELIQVSTQRSTLRRRARMAAVSLIGVLAALAIVLGLSATTARRVAEQRRAEAEGMMGFMLGDFVDKLRPIGKLDLLDSVSAKALEYLSRSDSGALNATSLTQRAKALQLIGEVAIERGKSTAAGEALQSARAILQRQLANDPEDRQVLKNLGANAFWLGRIQLEQGDLDKARQYFAQYLQHSDRLHALEPDNVEWWVEQSYAHSSLGSLALKQGDTKLAGAQFLLSIDLKTKAVAKTPQNRGLAADLANSLSFLGSTREAMGELDAAMVLYLREAEIVRRLHDAAPNDAVWSNRLALALQHQALLKRAQGQDDAALNDFRSALDLLNMALQQEPTNHTWQMNSVYVRLEILHGLARGMSAASMFSRLRDIDAELHSSALSGQASADWSRLNELIQKRTSRVLLNLGMYKEARRGLLASKQRLQGAVYNNPTSLSTRLSLVGDWLALAELEANAKDDTLSLQACQTASDLLANDAPHSSDYHLLDPWVRAQACLGHDAIVAEAKSRLAQLGYRETGYTREFSSDNKMEH